MATSDDCSRTFDVESYLSSGDASPCPPFGASVHIKGHVSAVKKEKSMSSSNNDQLGKQAKRNKRRKNDARQGRKQKKVHEFQSPVR